MIITWCCNQCGWANDNNNGACRRCGGDEDVKGKVRIRSDAAKIAAFDALAKAQRNAMPTDTIDLFRKLPLPPDRAKDSA